MNTILLKVSQALLVASVVTGSFVIAPLAGTAQTAYMVNPYNARPYWQRIANASVIQGQTLSTTALATDDNGDVLTYAALQLPAGASFNPTSRIFSFTPSYNQLGSFPVVLSVTDNHSAPVTTSFYVNVSTDLGHYVYGGGDASDYYNQAPYFTSTNSLYNINSGSMVQFSVTAIDPEGSEVRYSVSNLPAGASFSSQTRTVSWTPSASQRGVYTLVFTATDGVLQSVPFNVTITVDGGVNRFSAPTSVMSAPTSAPYFISNPLTVAIAGQTYVYAAQAVSPAGTTLRYTLLNGPVDAVLNSSTGVFAWTVPLAAADQTAPVSISVTDGYGTPVTQSFTMNVVGGQAATRTVVTRSVNTTRASQPTATPVSVSYYPTNSQTVYVNTGRTVIPSNYVATNYGVYGASAYGSLILPGNTLPIQAFNVAVRVNAKNEMIVSWDTNRATIGEVVFGYASHTRGGDTNRTILNYDFTTGSIDGSVTRHEVSLGALSLSQTYYLRIISRAGTDTDISREIVFIPMRTDEGKIIINQSEGAASAAGTLGALTGNSTLIFLLLIVIGLLVYLIWSSRMNGDQYLPEPTLELHRDDEPVS